MLIILFCLIFGLIIGSFLSVCIYRIPYGRSPLIDDESESEAEEPAKPEITVSDPPRSFCVSCKTSLKWYHNVPLFSWLALGGRCAYCKARISVRYPAVEVLTAILALLSYTHFGLTLTALVIFIFCAALLVISFIDYDYYIIPNIISLPGVIIGFALALANQYFHLAHAPLVYGIADALFGVLAGAGFLLLISEGYLRLRKKEGLGMGDVKLLAMVGAFFGVPGAFYTIFVGSLVGSVLGVLLLLLGGKALSHPLPFGPYLALGTFLYIFWGAELFSLALNLSAG